MKPELIITILSVAAAIVAWFYKRGGSEGKTEHVDADHEKRLKKIEDRHADEDRLKLAEARESGAFTERARNTQDIVDEMDAQLEAHILSCAAEKARDDERAKNHELRIAKLEGKWSGQMPAVKK